jgi:hypothetical protein
MESASKKRRFGEIDSAAEGLDGNGVPGPVGSSAFLVNPSGATSGSLVPPPAQLAAGLQPGTMQGDAEIESGAGEVAKESGQGQAVGGGGESGGTGLGLDPALSHENVDDDASLKEDAQNFVDGLVEQDGQDKTWEQVKHTHFAQPR